MKRSRTLISCPPFSPPPCRPPFCRTKTVYLTCIHIRFPRSARLCVHAHQAQMLIHGPLPQPAAHAAYRLTPVSVFITAQRPPHPTHTWSLTCTLPYTPCSPPSPPAPSKQASVASCCCHRPPRLPPIASDIHRLVAFPVLLSRRSLFWFFLRRRLMSPFLHLFYGKWGRSCIVLQYCTQNEKLQAMQAMDVGRFDQRKKILSVIFH